MTDPNRRHADPIAALLALIDERIRRGRPAEPVLGTIISLDPLTVRLDTGQVIENPVVIVPTEI